MAKHKVELMTSLEFLRRFNPHALLDLITDHLEALEYDQGSRPPLDSDFKVLGTEDYVDDIMEDIRDQDAFIAQKLGPDEYVVVYQGPPPV